MNDVHIEPTSGCWLWGGESQRIEVSLANIRRKTYSDKHGPHVGMQARPVCGCYWCVNPQHMALVAPKTKAERCKKWEGKNRERRAEYLKQYVDRNRERLNEQQNLRNFPGWARIIRAVVVCARDTLLNEAPVGLVPDQWVAESLGVKWGVVAAFRTRYRIQAASITVWKDCCECGARFTYLTSDGGNIFNRCDICRPRTRKVSTSTRNSVYKRDGGACRYCGVKVDVNFEVDHIVPWSMGGWDSVVNYALSCVQCNQTKGANRLEVYTEWRMIHDNLVYTQQRGQRHRSV